MLRKLFLTLCLLSNSLLDAQVNFENLTFGANSYWKGNPGVAGITSFSSGDASNYATFTNQNDTSALGDYWSGFAYSKLSDTVSLSYATNDCAAITASGNNNSLVYGVAYESFFPSNNIIKITGYQLQGFYITNTTIAYRSMQNGDGFAKKFGGASGTDPDYFRIIFSGWIGGQLSPDTVQVYLADFRDSNSANDYIVKTWKYVDVFNKFKDADSISFHLESSDTNSFGIKTPAYFCIDDIQINAPASTNTLTISSPVTIYPNPTTDFMEINNTSKEEIQVSCFNLFGEIVWQTSVSGNENKSISTNSWSNGTYIIQIAQHKNRWTQTVIKS